MSGGAVALPATNVEPAAPVVVEAPQSSLKSTNDDIDRILSQKGIGQNHILRRVAFCESANRQFVNNGSVLTGTVDSRDKGLFQVNSYYHQNTAEQLGMNIYTVEGNIDYALFLYSKNGLRDWNSSKPCWGRYLATI